MVDLASFYASLQRGELDIAAAMLETARADPPGPLERKLDADVHYRAGRFNRALDLYLKLGREFPRYVDHRYHLVDTCAHLGQCQVAEAELERMSSAAELSATAANQIFAEGWAVLGLDRRVMELDMNVSQPGLNRNILNTMRSHSVMRASGIAAGIRDLHKAFCTPSGWEEHSLSDEELSGYWHGQLELPRILQVRSRGGVGDLIQWIRYTRALEGAGVCLQVPGLGGNLPWTSPDRAPEVGALRAAGFRLGKSEEPMWTDPFTLCTALFPALGYAACDSYLGSSSTARTSTVIDRVRSRAHGKPCVGLFWSANESPDPFARKSMTLQHLGGLLAHDDVHWVVFQRGHERTKWVADARSGDRLRSTLVDDSSTFQECIALAGELDAMLSVDTGLAHAAAASGKPCVLVLNAAADWRWESSEQTGWYPTMSIVRAPVLGAWDDAVERAWQVLQDRLGTAPQALSASRAA